MKQDVNAKYYLNDRKRIADLLNGYFFQGIQCIVPEDVEEGGTQLLYQSEAYPLNNSKDSTPVHLEHDLLHKIIHGANYFVFSVEEQNYLDPSMVLRSLDYTVGQYMKQRHEIQKMHNRKKDLKEDEYVSRFSLEDLLKPVAIVVIYFGDKEWMGARTLHELLDWTDIPEEWKGMFMDYRMHLIEVQKIENLEWFHSDLKLLFGYLQNKNDKEKLSLFLDANYDELSEIPEDMFMVMASLSGRKQQKELEKQWKKQGKGRKVDMCKAIDDMLEDSRNDGLRIGREEGEERISKLFFCLISDNRLDDLKRAAQDKEFQNMLMKTYAI
ncbi:MAG: hypothetical protein MR936_16345 [Eubacterium sp.]|nr:hypothetical protein [Eubacterium sp.]